jgi:hypothetical protein
LQIGVGLDGKLLIAPGDIVDKYTILLLKIVMLRCEQDKKFAREELSRTIVLLQQVVDLIPVSTFHFFGLLSELLAINTEQWKCEDRVRTENSWQAAQAARECNSRRVRKKNEINKLFGYPVEVKQYQTNDDTNS